MSNTDPQAGLTERVSAVLGVVWKVPWPWTALMVVTALLTSVNVTRTPGGDFTIEVAVGTLSVVALALIWLPALLRLLVLTGGSVKAGNVEAQTGGLLSSTDLFQVATQTKAVATAQGDDATRSVAIAELEATVDELLARGLWRPPSSLRESLRPLSTQYERLRRDTPSGAQRTSAMTRIVNEARVRGAASPDTAHSLAPELLRSLSEGDRIVGLALAQEVAPVTAFAEVLRLVPGSASAFEMYHALLALQELSAVLTGEQRKQAIKVLEAESADPRGVGINQDVGLPTLMKRTLMQLRSAGQVG